MKKFILLFAIQFIFLSLTAQKTVFVDLDFSGTFPPTGWTFSSQASHWTAQQTVYSGGTAPELRFDWSPQYNGVTRMISPVINTTGLTSLHMVFKNALSHYDGAYTIGVATSSDGGTTWNNVWSKVNPTASYYAANEAVVINNADVGSANFQICLFFNGDSYNINDWWVDDFMLFTPYALDGEMYKITTKTYNGQGNIDIKGTIKNMGKNPITSYTVNYTIDGGTVQSTNITSVNVAFGATHNFNCTQQWAATPGEYLAKVWLSDVNGAGPDSNQMNDTLSKTLKIATQTTTRLPIFEEFTSSTCAPCASFNSSTFTPFVNSHPGEFSLIKYQMNWPGSGDIYYTAEGGTRRTYYGVSGVPDLYIDGRESQMSSAGLLTDLTTEASSPTFFTIGVTPTYLGTDITIPVTVMPYLTGAFKLYVVVIEKTTTGNVGSNGETSFKNVMMKMYPNGSGTSLNMTAGTAYTNTFTGNLSSTHVEQMSDLMVVVFIQENTTKEIFQSAFNDVTVGIDATSDENIAVYPNPATENVLIMNAASSDLMLYDMFGKLILSENSISNNYSLNVSSLAKGTYILKLIDGEKVISKKITVLK